MQPPCGGKHGSGEQLRSGLFVPFLDSRPGQARSQASDAKDAAREADALRVVTKAGAGWSLGRLGGFLVWVCLLVFCLDLDSFAVGEEKRERTFYKIIL